MSIQVGKNAEDIAARHLQKIGYRIVSRNWRRPDCEVDIVARNKKTRQLHFFEVKYRRNNSQGGGLDSLTIEKLKQMSYTAIRYVSEHDLQGAYCLGAIEVSGKEYEITAVIEEINSPAIS